MSMQEHPNSGYVIEVEKLGRAIIPDSIPKFQELLEENCDSDLHDFLSANMKPGLPSPIYVYTLTDEDTPGENMQLGETYAVFEQSDLFVLTKTPAGRMFETQVGEVPTFDNWVVYG